MYNTIVAAGYLVSDPETRDVNSKKVCKIRMCISGNRVQDKDKCFIDVELWNRQAEIAQEYLKKGRSIIVNGELRLSSWEKDGQKHQKYFITGNSFSFLNTGSSNDESDNSSSSSKSSKAVEEDVPF